MLLVLMWLKCIFDDHTTVASLGCSTPPASKWGLSSQSYSIKSFILFSLPVKQFNSVEIGKLDDKIK